MQGNGLFCGMIEQNFIKDMKFCSIIIILPCSFQIHGTTRFPLLLFYGNVRKCHFIVANRARWH